MNNLENPQCISTNELDNAKNFNKSNRNDLISIWAGSDLYC